MESLLHSELFLELFKMDTKLEEGQERDYSRYAKYPFTLLEKPVQNALGGLIFCLWKQFNF